MPDEAYRLIPLYGRGDVIRGYTMVDPDDYERFGDLRWNLGGNGYVTHSTISGMRLHREILGLVRGDGLKGDHIDGNLLDNRKSNLRIATQAQNGQNRVRLSKRNKTGYRGVILDKATGRYSAEMMVEGVRIRKHGYRTAEEADRAVRALRAQYMPFANELGQNGNGSLDGTVPVDGNVTDLETVGGEIPSQVPPPASIKLFED